MRRSSSWLCQHPDVDVRALVDEQIRYYSERAAEYDDTATPPGDSLAPFGASLEAALERSLPQGQVLEIACGTGSWTARLLRHAQEITALDASSEMLALAKAKVGDDRRVRFLRADVFTWEPDARYDVVFFANWLSHVPPELFAAFWDVVAAALRPDGRVFLVDELEDAWRQEHQRESFVGGTDIPIVRRSLTDGREFEIVKVFWLPRELEDELRELGWTASVHAAGPFFWAEAAR
jgi:demethylmenaquinone methyltransferase/2-methoxy-6-polyprenyl-1,4-benzoquinol methylase